MQRRMVQGGRQEKVLVKLLGPILWRLAKERLPVEEVEGLYDGLPCQLVQCRTAICMRSYFCELPTSDWLPCPPRSHSSCRTSSFRSRPSSRNSKTCSAGTPVAEDTAWTICSALRAISAAVSSLLRAHCRQQRPCEGPLVEQRHYIGRLQAPRHRARWSRRIGTGTYESNEASSAAIDVTPP